MSADAATERLIARARRELPEPGDPRQLIDDLLAEDLAGAPALEILSRTSLAHRQLRDLRLERAWQSSFGWFLARNLMLLGFLALLATMVLGFGPGILEAALAGAAAFYLLTCALMPLRLRRHRRRRAAILEAYGRDLSDYLDTLAR